jgi:hypothetical protein
VKKDEMGRACSTHGERRNAYKIFGELEGKRPLGIPTSGWEDIIKIDRREVCWCGM